MLGRFAFLSCLIAIVLGVVFYTPPGFADPSSAADTAQRLLHLWAPTFLQRVAPKDQGQDRPTRIDFDGDYDLTNNWANQARLAEAAPTYVYGAAVLSESHAYLSYYLYYPRDWTRPACLPFVCHENDFEALLLVVALGEGDSGKLALAETKAHLGYASVPGPQIALDVRQRPVVMVEAYGHGMHICRRADSMCTPTPSSLVLEIGDQASITPRTPHGERMSYRLLSLYDTLWSQRHTGGARGLTLWDMTGEGPLFYTSAPLGRVGHPMGTRMAGRAYGAVARPPWGLSAPGTQRGDWFLDPQTVMLRHSAVYPGAGASRYVHHPFLDDLLAECVGRSCGRPAPPPAPPALISWGSYGACGGLFVLLLWRRRRLAWRRAPPDDAP